MWTRIYIILLLISVLAALSGCAEMDDSVFAAVDDEQEAVADTGKGDTVVFTDDEHMGAVVFRAPVELDPHQINLMRTDGNTQNLWLDRPFRLIPGEHCATVTNPQSESRTSCFDVSVGELTVVELAAWKVTVEGMTRRIGPSRVSELSVRGSNGAMLQTVEVNPDETYESWYWNLAYPGDLTFEFEDTSEVVVLEAGQVLERRFVAQLPSAEIRIFPPTERATPDRLVCGALPTYLLTASPTMPNFDDWGINEHILQDGSYSAARTFHDTYVISPHRSTTLRVYVDDYYKYFLYVNGTYTEVDVTPGERTEVHLRRIDVENVRVTREDGTEYRARASWTLYDLSESRGTQQRVTWKRTECRYRDDATATSSQYTASGVDVIPGTYRVNASPHFSQRIVEHRAKTF